MTLYSLVVQFRVQALYHFCGFDITKHDGRQGSARQNIIVYYNRLVTPADLSPEYSG